MYVYVFYLELFQDYNFNIVHYYPKGKFISNNTRSTSVQKLFDLFLIQKCRRKTGYGFN